jgi:hypothetical protein
MLQTEHNLVNELDAFYELLCRAIVTEQPL